MVEVEPKSKEQEAKERDYQIYRKPEDKPSCDKGDHKKRSLYHQPNHQQHWSKENQNS